MTFWWRRCSEHSRSPRWMTLPWLSARTWTSMCRGVVTSRSRNSVSSPKALAATRRAVARVASRSSGAFDDVHALPAAAGGGLDQQREADAGRGLDQLRVRHAGFGDARDHRDAVAGDVVLGADLVAHDVQGFDAGADERDPGLLQGAGEVDVLAQEAVARVHGLGAGVAAGLDDGLDLEVALGGGRGADPHGDVGLAHVPGAGVGVGIDGDRADAQGAQGADHAAGDLAAVGDEHGAEQRVRRCVGVLERWLKAWVWKK